MSKYKFLLLSVILSVVFSFNRIEAQSVNYEKEWSSIDSLLKKQYFEDAYRKADSVYRLAVKHKDSRHSLIGAIYLSDIGSVYRENSSDTALQRFTELLPELDDVEKSLCIFYIADYLSQIYDNNRWSILRNTETDQTDLDYRLWSADRYRDSVESLLRLAFADVAMLQAQDSREMKHLAYEEQTGDDGNLTPTLYDMMVLRLLRIFNNLNCNRLTAASFVRPELLFAEADRFVGISPIKVADKQSFASFVLQQMQLRERMHLDRHSSDRVQMSLFKSRIEQLPVQQDNARNYRMSVMPDVIAHYRKRNDEYITNLYYQLASDYSEIGRNKDAMKLIDTALALHPESEGAALCKNLRYGIEEKQMSFTVPEASPSGQHILAYAQVRNVDTLFFRVIKKIDIKWKHNVKDEERRNKLLSQKVLKEWTLPVDKRDDYKEQSTFFAVPPLPQGDYMLLASYVRDFKERLDVVEFEVADVAIISLNGQKMKGFVVERMTGRPVSGVEVKIKRRNALGKITLATMKSDKHGFFDFSKSVTLPYYDDYLISVQYKGKDVVVREWNDDEENDVYNQRVGTELFCDRPVYRPGDTVRFAYWTYAKNRYDGKVLDGVKDTLILRDVNRKAVDSLFVKTDSYGAAEGFFVLPSDALPGNWTIINVKKGNFIEYLKVEAYKQPKFTVAVSVPAEEHAFGKMARFDGVAASYNAVPIAGARVEYRIRRCNYPAPWRWRWWWNEIMEEMTETVVAEGETVTDDNGLFHIDFIPEVDSNIDLSKEPLFKYTVTVKVTDINGETHEANKSFTVGYKNRYLSARSDNGGSDSASFKVWCYNLDGKALETTASVVVERLTMPSKYRELHNIMEEAPDTTAMPFDRKTFEKMFPAFYYSASEARMENWKSEKVVSDVTCRIEGDKPYVYSFKGMPAGIYHLVAMSVAGGDTIRTESFMAYVPSDAIEPVSPELFYVRADKYVAEVGDTVHLRVGSHLDDVSLYVVVHQSGTVFRRTVVTPHKGYTTIDVPVCDTMRGGFEIELASMHNNQFSHIVFPIEVPHNDKKLEVAFTTFRDKLEPGEKEVWTLKINNKDGGGADANLLLTMYDHALDSYGYLGWRRIIWSEVYNTDVFEDMVDFGTYYSAFYPDRIYYRAARDYRFGVMALRNGLSYGGWYNNRIVTMVAGVGYSRAKNRVSSTARGEDGMVEEEVYQELDAIPVIEVGTPESGQRIESADFDNTSESEILSLDMDSAVKEEQEEKATYVRQNLNTLAFFEPTLRSNADGVVELSFMAPDLLTEWSIEGVSWTRDLRFGTVSSKAITQKRLMVVPNVPRFLRHGDTCQFSVKVSNMDVKEQEVRVSLTMTDAADGMAVAMVKDDTVKRITLKAGGSGEVSFRLVVPDDVYVVNYLVMARGKGCSDGEQAPIPLLPSRQLVTESMAFYINGAGEKRYEMKHLTSLNLKSKNNTLRPQGLIVDMTPNPIWMAIQSIPYMGQQENPSNIYLANSIYTNSLSLAIVQNNKEIESMFREWEREGQEPFMSELDRNPDLKQTVMEETPWLRDALGEEQRHRDVARFFNRTTLERQLQNDMSRLLDAQRGDGAWSWIAGGRWASLYTTQYILKSFGLLMRQGVELDGRTRQALNKAMDYVDRETYSYYQKYLKDKGYDVVNLDYLYVRSYYPDNKLSKKQQEAYDFFYNNAKKNNESYRSLYCQSMLSVVFQRQGDTKLAVEMAKRIKQKALYSDEMGMYWRDNVSGWRWSERPIETQAMLIRMMDEVLNDSESVARMQQWILKQKQTNNWNTDVSTVNAIQALLAGGGGPSSPVRMRPSRMSVTFGDHVLTSDTSRHDIHLSRRLAGDEVRPADGKIVVRKEDDGIAWGAVYWQYFEQMDKIPSNSMGISLKRSLYRIDKDGVMRLVADGSALRVGDKVRVRIEIVADRTMEYLELKDPRNASMEPVNTASGWHWNGGLSYYLSVTNTAQTLYIDRLEKGRYMVEYDLYVNNAGVYTSAPTVMQCLYAPEFRALCPAGKVRVE